MTNEFSIKVLEAYTRDVGRGIARIDYDTMDKLGCSTGNIIKIINVDKKIFTVSKVLPLYPSDGGKGILRCDGLIRENAHIKVNDVVLIERIENVYTCVKVIVSPLESVPPIDPPYLSEALDQVPVTKNDVLMIPYFGGRLKYKVVEVSPNEVGIVSTNTVFEVIESDEAVKYSSVGKTFKEKEEKLKDELIKIVTGTLDDSTIDHILVLENKINEIHKVRKIVFRILNELQKEPGKI